MERLPRAFFDVLRLRIEAGGPEAEEARRLLSQLPINDAAPTSGAPLTAERIERALEARSRFEGNDAEFLGTGFAWMFSDPDTVAIVRDYERLMWLHSAALYGPDSGPAGMTPDEMALYATYAERFRAVSKAMPLPAVSTEIGPDDPEARAWLAAPGHAMANERFDSATEALAFVEQLYAAGAERVVVPASSLREGGASAEALLVELPVDRARRAAVLEIVNREAREEGFDEDQDTGQPTVLLWWD